MSQKDTKVENNELPDGYKLKKLGDLAQFINGRAFKPQEWEKEGLPIIRIQNLTNSSDHINYYSGDFDEKHLINNGDLLLAWSATLDVFIWNKSKAILNQHIFKVLPDENTISKKFLYYLLRNLIDKMKSHTHGSGMVHITKPKLLSLKVNIPSLIEQQNFVEKLDIQLKQIDLIKKEVKKQKNSINEFYRSFLQKQFINKEKWKSLKFGELFDTKYGISKKAVKDISKIKALRMNNISYDGELNTEDLTYLDLSKKEIEKHRLRKGDLLFNRTNSSELVGKTTVFNEDDLYVAVSYIVVATPKIKEINSNFVSFYLNAPEMKRYFYENCNKAISQSNFSASKLKEIYIPFPSENVQSEIVNKINLMKNKLEELKLDINTQVFATDYLSKSVLTEVFKQFKIIGEN